MFTQPQPGPGDGDPLAHLARAALVSEDAAAELVRATQADVWRLCRALSDEQAAHDLLQDTYLRVFESLPTFRGDSTLRVWILAIARRTAADHVRQAVRQRRLSALLRNDRSRDATAPPHQIETRDLIERLPTSQRTAFVLTQVLGLTYDEAGTIMACPTGTIRSRVARARDTLITLITLYNAV